MNLKTSLTTAMQNDKPQNVTKLSVQQNCLNFIKKNWKADNFLQLNADKTEVFTSVPAAFVPKETEILGSLSSSVISTLQMSL